MKFFKNVLLVILPHITANSIKTKLTSICLCCKSHLYKTAKI